MDPLYMTACWTHHGEPYIDQAINKGEPYIDPIDNMQTYINDEGGGVEMHEFLNETFVQPLIGQSEGQTPMEQKHGHTPDPIEAFNLVYKKKDKHKSWIDEASELMGELTQLVATHGEETQN
ncbi:hypothetical protein Fot_24625 [Forsythia ovata]|uniref:Uncharacterized protein n=1 Tax=Forsythia ovata TaxID=205694 RepID=A0ABD1U6Q6_9LAMI